MITIYDSQSGSQIGLLTEAQFQFLTDHLEEESAEDQDYYINVATIDAQGADPELIAMLRRALGTREEMDIRWEEA
jgi:hypothetical protein